MPTYQYRCQECGEHLEAVQKFTDEALTDCPKCGKAALRKQYGSVGVVFKGSGFYRNDSRAERQGKTAGTENKSDKAKADTKDTAKKSDTKSADKPATKTDKPSTSSASK